MMMLQLLTKLTTKWTVMAHGFIWRQFLPCKQGVIRINKSFLSISLILYSIFYSDERKRVGVALPILDATHQGCRWKYRSLPVQSGVKRYSVTLPVARGSRDDDRFNRNHPSSGSAPLLLAMATRIMNRTNIDAMTEEPVDADTVGTIKVIFFIVSRVTI